MAPSRIFVGQVCPQRGSSQQWYEIFTHSDSMWFLSNLPFLREQWTSPAKESIFCSRKAKFLRISQESKFFLSMIYLKIYTFLNEFTIFGTHDGFLRVKPKKQLLMFFKNQLLFACQAQKLPTHMVCHRRLWNSWARWIETILLKKKNIILRSLLTYTRIGFLKGEAISRPQG